MALFAVEIELLLGWRGGSGRREIVTAVINTDSRERCLAMGSGQNRIEVSGAQCKRHNPSCRRGRGAGRTWAGLGYAHSSCHQWRVLTVGSSHSLRVQPPGRGQGRGWASPRCCWGSRAEGSISSIVTLHCSDSPKITQPQLHFQKTVGQWELPDQRPLWWARGWNHPKIMQYQRKIWQMRVFTSGPLTWLDLDHQRVLLPTPLENVRVP